MEYIPRDIIVRDLMKNVPPTLNLLEDKLFDLPLFEKLLGYKIEPFQHPELRFITKSDGTMTIVFKPLYWWADIDTLLYELELKGPLFLDDVMSHSDERVKDHVRALLQAKSIIGILNTDSNRTIIYKAPFITKELPKPLVQCWHSVENVPRNLDSFFKDTGIKRATVEELPMKRKQETKTPTRLNKKMKVTNTHIKEFL